MRNVLKAILLTMLSYLLQVCAMPYLRIDGVIGSIVAVNIAILTVTLGKKYAFGASCMTGILMDVMTSSISGLYAVLYPAISMALSMLFADMSDERREVRRNRNKSDRDVDAHIRIPLNAMAITLMFDGILLVYTTLSGAVLTGRHLARLLIAVLYTGALSGALMWPVRMFLGMYARIEKAVTDGENDEEI